LATAAMNIASRIFLVAAGSLLFANATLAGLCQNWSQGTTVGTLDHTIIHEASGLAASRKFPKRLYHVNDSGGGPFFYITNLQGNHTQSIRIQGFDASSADFEDISLGPCSANASCLFIGDIGDNLIARETIQILVIEEKSEYAEPVVPLHKVTLTYPDRPHNAEGMAVHPNGDIYVLTKEVDLKQWRTFPAKLFKLERERWENSQGQVQTLTPVGEIDFPYLAAFPFGLLGHIVTAFDIAPDGSTFLALTYEYAFEFHLDLATSTLKPARELREGEHYRLIKLRLLPQQESISYLPGAKSFIYDTEFLGENAEIIRVDCLD
jgi:hypothetical protein